MTLEENSQYFVALAAMLPRIVKQDLTEQTVSKKYSKNPSGAKKRKRKNVAKEDEETENSNNTDVVPVKKPKTISVEKVPSLEIGELKMRLQMKIEQSRTSRNYSKEKLHRRREKRTFKEQEKKAVQRPKVKSINVETAIVDDKKSKPKKSEKLQFSKFETKTKNEIELQSNKKKKKKKDLNKMLDDAKKKKKELTTLKKSTDSVSVGKLQDKAWKKAISMAKGEKQTDNPDLIVKTIKRTEQKKKKASKEWNDRTGGQKKLQKDKQKKRQANIEKRIQGTKKRKMK